MSMIDPKLFATGIGAVTGGYFLSTDNDIMGIAVGAAIGGGTGMFMDYSMPDKLDNRAARAAGYSNKTINTDNVRGRGRTFEQRKESLLKQAERRAKRNSKASDTFDSSKPFSTLNSGSLEDFKHFLDNVKSVESLDDLENKFKYKTDEIAVKASDIDPNSEKIPVNQKITIKANSSLSEKQEALKKYLIGQYGYKDNSVELKNKLSNFSKMLDVHEGMITIEDGVLKLTDTNTRINLSTQVTTDKGHVGSAFISNNQVYYRPNVNLMGIPSLHSKDTKVTTKAVADALGISMTNAFNLQAALSEVAGMAPDDAIALMYPKLKDNPDVFNKFVEYMNDKKVHSAADSANFTASRMKGKSFSDALPTAKNSDARVLNTTDFGYSINMDNQGNIHENLITKVGTTSDDGISQSLHKEIVRKYSEMTGDNFAGSKADKVLELPSTHVYKRDSAGKLVPEKNTSSMLFNLNAPHERGVATVNNRQIAYADSTKNNNIINIANEMVAKYSGDQYNTAHPMLTASIDSEQKITLDGGKGTTAFNAYLGDIFGGDKVTDDGQGLMNLERAKQLDYSKKEFLNVGHNAKGEYTIIDPIMRKHITGELSYDDFRKGALTGATAFNNRFTGKLQKAKNKLEALQNITSNTSLSAKEKFNQIKKLSPEQFKNIGIDKYTKKGRYTEEQAVDLAVKKAQRAIGRTLKRDKTYTGSERLANINEVQAERSNVNNLIKSFNHTKDISSNLDVVDELLEHGKEAKQFKQYSDSYFPRVGHTYAVNLDGSLVQAKANSTSTVFMGFGEDVKDGNKRLLLGFDSNINIGQMDVVKAFGEATKAQQRITNAEDIIKIAMLDNSVDKSTLVYNPEKGTSSFKMRMSDGSFHKFNDVSNRDLANLSIEDLFKKHIDTNTSKLNVVDEAAHVRSMYGNLDMIAEQDSGGMKIKNNLMNALKEFQTTGKSNDLDKMIPTGNLFNQHIKDNMLKLSKSGANIDKELHGLANMYLASSNSKLSQDILMTSNVNYLAKGHERIKELLANPTDAGITQFKKDFGLVDDFGTHSSFNAAAAEQALNKNIDELMELFSEHKNARQNSWAYLTNQFGMLDHVTDHFINEAKLRADHEHNLLVRMASFGQVAEGESGSGKIEKNMSWNARRNLLLSGYSHNDLDMFMGMNAKLLADYNTIQSLTAEDPDKYGHVINDQIDSSAKQKALLAALNEDGSKRRGILSRAGINIDADKSIGIYSLQSGIKNEHGISHLPIVLENSKLFDSYTGSDGVERSKKFHNIVQSAINADTLLASGELPEYSQKKVREQLLKDLDYIAKESLNIQVGSGNLSKKTLTFEAPASMYSLTTAYDQSWIQGVKKANPNINMAIVSSEGLLKRLESIGGEIGKHKSISSLMKAGNLEEVGEKGSGVYRVTIGNDSSGNKVPLFSLNTREPSTGPGSTLLSEYFVDTNIIGNEGTMFMSSDDMISKKFQLKDLDYDHQTEVFSKRIGKHNMDALSAMVERGRGMNKQFEEMLDFVAQLGVKGKNKDEIGSFANFIQAGMSDEQDYIKAISDDSLTSRIKGGDRKTVSPIATNVATVMSSAIGESDASDVVKLRSRMLTHYFVENLLKSQHIANEAYKTTAVTTAERLGHLLQNGQKSEFISEFGTYIEDNIIKNISANDAAQKAQIEQQIRESYKFIQEQLEKTNAVGKEAITPLDIKRRGLVETTNMTREVLEGVNTSVGIAPLDEQIKAESEMSIVERGKMNYHRASEIVKHNISNNKKLLMGSGAAMIGAALLTQSKPDFGNKSAQSNPSGMLLDPHRESLKEQARQQGFMGDVHRATEYISPYSTNSRSNVHVDGEYMDYNGSGDLGADINHAVFGDGMSNFRVLLE